MYKLLYSARYQKEWLQVKTIWKLIGNMVECYWDRTSIRISKHRRKGDWLVTVNLEPENRCSNPDFTSYILYSLG